MTSQNGPALGPSIDDVIDRQLVRTLFQPVVDLATGSICGFEALSRGPVGSALESPMALLEAARAAGRLGELDWLCRSRAMLAAADAGLPETLSWLINVEPAGWSGACPPHLVGPVDRARAELRVILEVVERDVQGSVLELIRASDQARRYSWGVALDDVGAEEGSLALLPFLRPDVVKLDMSLVRGVPQRRGGHDHRRGAGLRRTDRGGDPGRGHRDPGAGTAGPGLRRHLRTGLLLRPARAAPGVDRGAANPIPLGQYVAPIDGRTPFEVLAATIEPQRADKQHVLHISAHLEDQAAQDSHASVLLAAFQKSGVLHARDPDPLRRAWPCPTR